MFLIDASRAEVAERFNIPNAKFKIFRNGRKIIFRDIYLATKSLKEGDFLVSQVKKDGVYYNLGVIVVNQRFYAIEGNESVINSIPEVVRGRRRGHPVIFFTPFLEPRKRNEAGSETVIED